MYYSDFKKALEDGTLQLNANSGALKYEGISQKDWTERILSALSAEYADGGIQSQEPLKNITDKNGNVVYTDVADMLTPILDIPCAPEGYDSLLDYMNSTSSKTRNFKGNLNDAFEQLDNARDLFPAGQKLLRHWMNTAVIIPISIMPIRITPHRKSSQIQMQPILPT